MHGPVCIITKSPNDQAKAARHNATHPVVHLSAFTFPNVLPGRLHQKAPFETVLKYVCVSAPPPPWAGIVSKKRWWWTFLRTEPRQIKKCIPAKFDLAKRRGNSS